MPPTSIRARGDDSESPGRLASAWRRETSAAPARESSCPNPAPGPRRNHALGTGQADVGDHRERDGKNRAHDQRRLEVADQPVEDQAPQAALSDQRRDRDQPDRGHRRNPNPGHDRRESKRDIDLPQLGQRTKPHPAGGLANLRGNRIQSHDDGAAQDEQGVADQPNLRRPERQPGKRDQDGEEGEGGDGIENAGERGDGAAQESLAPGDQPQRYRDYQPNHDRDYGQLDVLRKGGADDLCVAGYPIPPDPWIVRCPEDPG